MFATNTLSKCSWNEKKKRNKTKVKKRREKMEKKRIQNNATIKGKQNKQAWNEKDQ